MKTEEIFSIFKKNAGALGKGNEIYPPGAQLGCIELSGLHDRRPCWHEASIAGWDGRRDLHSHDARGHARKVHPESRGIPGNLSPIRPESERP